jgi:hypothetical protein
MNEGLLPLFFIIRIIMIKLIRLMSGEEIIANVVDKDIGIEVSDVSLIVPTEKGIGLMDYMPYSTISDSTTFIKNDFIAFVTEPVDGLKKQYQQIHSKLITPNQSIIT